MSADSIEALAAKVCAACGQRFTSDACFCPFDGEPLKSADAPLDPVGDPLIGTVVDGRYEVIRCLGEGGMGTVYRVVHRGLQRTLAMKVLRRDLASDAELCTRFIREARAAATINHPNVVQITDYGTLADGSPFFVMEHLEGKPLASLLRSGGPLPAGQAVRMLVQIAAGLGAAHRAGIIHRDLKPDNIFVVNPTDSSPTVKVLDFGVAKVIGSAKVTRTGIVFGSPHYMSPEQAAGRPIDHRADIYSMGVLMYEIFTGRVPFEADTFMGVLTKHIFMSPEPFGPGIESAAELGALEDITMRCLAKNPVDRFPTMEALVDAIEEVFDGSGLPSTRPPRRRSHSDLRLADELELPLRLEMTAARNRRDQDRVRHRRAVAAMAASLMLLVAALTALVWVRNRPVTQPMAALTHTVGPAVVKLLSNVPSMIEAPAPSATAETEPVPEATAPAAATVVTAPAVYRPRSSPPPEPDESVAQASETPSEEPPAAPESQPKSATQVGEIVNPWGD